MIYTNNELQENCLKKHLSSLPSRAPFVGRQMELTFLTNCYEAAKSGFAQVVLVSGEAGIGKTCLLNEFARHTSQDGAIVLRGNASSAEGMPLYLPFLEALGQYIRDTTPDQLRKQMTPAT